MFETPKLPLAQIESQKEIKIEVYSGYTPYIPEEFETSPFEYFETQGINIKPGETKYEEGKVKEDPAAVKDFPVWKNSEGKELRVVAKRVNTEKGKVGKTANPFHEAEVMEKVRALGLPAPAPIAKIQKGEQFLILMERAEGVTLFDMGLEEAFKEWAYSEEDKQQLKQDAEQRMSDLQGRFEKMGIKRKWKLADMVFEIDFQQKKVIGITPVD